MYIGGRLVIVSVPFRIAYKKYKKIAASLSLQNRRVSYPKEGNLCILLFPFYHLKLISFIKKKNPNRFQDY